MRRLLLVLALLGALALHAAARAGGGGSYSGGGSSYSSSSHGSGGGSGGGILLWYYFAWVIRHPLPGIPLTLFFVYLLSRTNYKGAMDASRRGGPAARGGQTRAGLAEALAPLRARDPGFEEAGFLRRAGVAFLKIQQAWSDGDMAPARAFISDGVNERFGRQLAGMKAKGLKNLMERVEVLGMELLACRSDAHFDALWVRVRASASDRMVDAAGRTVSGGVGRQEFEEVWSFLRRPGAKTLKTPGLIEGRCPSCGAPLPIADAASCAACKAWVNSGEYDWVLSEITQSCEWSLLEPSRDVDGWAEVSVADPALNLPALEDRASVMFWRWLDARRAGDPAAVRAVADADFCRAFPTTKVGALGDAAVGSVEAVAFEAAGEWTLAHIAVKWSAGGPPRTEFFTLKRAASAKTDARQGLRTARCASCGAPAAGSSAAACAYCSAPLNDGRKDWVLTAVVPYGFWKRPVRARPAPVPVAESDAATAPVPAGKPASGLGWGRELSPVDSYAVLAQAMLADGEESLAEKAFLQAYADSRAIPPAKAEVIADAARKGELQAPVPMDPAQAEILLRGMIRMSLADGAVTDAERNALNSFGVRYGLRPENIDKMVERERPVMKG